MFWNGAISVSVGRGSLPPYDSNTTPIRANEEHRNTLRYLSPANKSNTLCLMLLPACPLVRGG